MAAPMRQAPGNWAPPYHDVGRDKFTNFVENSFKIVREAPVSTFSIDVDTASYSWVRASLNQNVLPQPAVALQIPDAIRVEQLVRLHIPLGDLPSRLDALPDTEDGTLAVVCRSGGRSSRAVAWLSQQGFDVANVEGGMKAWEVAGKQLVADGAAATVK